MTSAPCIEPYGTAGFFIELPGRGQAELRALREQIALLLPGADVVLGGGALAVLDVPPTAALASEIQRLLRLPLSPRPAGALHELQVVYDGIDLDETAQLTRLTPAEVARLHASVEYEVEVQGFLPGFAYLGELPRELRLPRLATPRPRVSANNVGIAERYTGIYPFDSPGGWRLIGRAVEPRLFNPTASPAMRLALGDRVRFVPTPAEAAPVPPRIRPRTSFEPGRAGLIVERVTGAVTVQDGGRPGLRGAGIPPSGALDAALLARANASLGSARDQAALELWLGGATVRAETARGEGLWVSLDGEPMCLAAGERLEIEPSAGAVRYLAVEGGVAVPEVLGSRSTLLVARLGGYEGRALRPGDRVPVGSEPARAGASAAFLGGAKAPASASRSLYPAPPDAPDAPVRLDPGPHAARLGHHFEQLLAGDFVLSELSDRVGLRLEPGAVDGAPFELERPVPVVRGAVQLTPNGTLVIFGPDHPVTGGYPQIGVVRPDSFAALTARRPGARVRFIASAPP